MKERLGFAATVQAVRTVKALFPDAVAVLVEDKANGPAVISALERTVSGIIAVQPDGSKVARASAVSPFVEAGNVYLPEFAPFTPDFVEEHAAFPLSTNDDMVDTGSQALTRLLLHAVRPRVRFL